MTAAQSSAPSRASTALVRLRTAQKALVSTVAQRLFLDRQAAFWLGEANAAWSLTEIRARVVAVVDETHDTKTFVLKPNAAWRGHRAGQYVPVEVEIDGTRVRRCYSISSAPGASRVAITVKRVPGGRVSSWMHANLHRGDVVGLGEAAGDFVLPAAMTAPAKLLLLSGGSGVTPVMGILRDLAARGAVGDVAFVHCARTRDDVIFRAAVEALAVRHPGLRVALCLDNDPAGGLLDEARLRSLVPDFAERETFLCGPAGLMDKVEQMWERAGVASKLRRERFVAAGAASTAAATAQGAQGATVRLARSGRSLVASASGTLLEQLERAGERPAYGCRMGICQTCRCRKRSGTVVNVVTGAVSSEPDEDIRLCVSAPRSDIELAL